MTESNSQPFIVVKPSEVIRNVLLNKKYCELIERYPRKQHYISNKKKKTGKNWTEGMASPSAILREDQYFIGDKVKCRIEGKTVSWEIKKFYHKDDGDTLFVDVHMHEEYGASQDLLMEIPVVSEEVCTILLSAIECKIEDSQLANAILGRETKAKLFDLQYTLTKHSLILFPQTIKTQKNHQNLHTGLFIERQGAPNGYNAGYNAGNAVDKNNNAKSFKLSTSFSVVRTFP
ncbi:unnamed protein product [Mytilus coruscus]|uniref:Uncharacterized protein n=1 Tax=Mytilus coruscus TaxID=42192 RepID=A0A6J8DLS2_MYTCO|nr:unnamed protein product [Mytilus coruscus]